ncbi:RagB/SusD family nutrient uptake outer membrane protein [Rhodohalobacter sp. 614A]|uniref:RagB/SusD family nutrient uptake outer membrane protein n=1 Tax=Rhodohalobacter sp. 614A TaxID=2908649 RepID=UPI001F22B517|nr:RagB/SusD family nutrient uptake outer membrane protein [Rhodohalobacter sp. 614A]
MDLIAKKLKLKASSSAPSLLFFLMILGTALFFSSCEESVLDTTPYGQTTTDNFWRNANDADAAINAVYAPLTSIWGHTIMTLINIPDDDQYRAGDHGDHASIENFTYDASLGKLNSTWQAKYEIIQRANGVLINVPDIEMDQTLKNRVLGEAYFLRGFAYWTLAKLFGGVPLILEQDVIDDNFNKPRASLDDTYAQIESDFIKAAELLPEQHSGSDIGRAHSGAAWGYLATLYMYEERFQDAIDAGDHVINGPYPLTESFDDNFKVETQYNPEILFTIGSAEGWQTQSNTIYTTPRPWGGWDFQAPLPNLIEEFEEGDPRLDYSIMMPGDVFDLGGDRGPTEYTADLSPTTGYHFEKWAAWRSEGGLDLNMNLPMLRSAEVYLYVSEAKIRSGGNGDAELNVVRARSGMPPVTNATMEDIIHERRVELAGEGSRHFDLMRWDRAGIVDITEIYGEDRGPYDPPRLFIRPKHYFYAIPQNQIDVSGGVLEQNPGH